MPPPSEAPAISGRAFAPDLAQEVPARLAREGAEAVLRLPDGADLRRAPAATLRRPAPLGRLDRRVEWPDGAIFLTGDAAGLDALFGRARGHGLHGMERLHPRLVAAVAVAVLGLVAIWRWGLSALVALAVLATPPAVLPRIDAALLVSLDAVTGDSRLPPGLRGPADDAFARLVAAAPPPPRGAAYQLVFRDMGSTANALALPGGTIVVTDALVRQAGADIDQVAGVLAHEIVHVDERHGLGNLYRSLAVYVVIALAAGDTGPILDEILLEGNALLSLAGTREMERRADRGGVALARAAGYDPTGLARFLEAAAARHGEGGGWLSTHPGNAERATEIRRLSAP